MRHPSKTGPGRAALLTALLMAAAACDETTPTTPAPPVTGHVNESFVGTIDVGASRFYSFSAGSSGTIELTLLSVRQGGDDIGQRLIMGIGTPAGTGCALQNSVTTGAGISAQLTTGVVAPGVYCAQIADDGTMTEPVSFAINIARPQ
jgi:hypothetical protein